MPVGTQSDDFVIQINTDPTGHADDHAFPVQDFTTFFEVIHQVSGQHFEAVIVSDHGLQRRPFGFQLLLGSHFLSFGDFLKVFVDRLDGRIIKAEFDNPGFVINRHRGLVMHSPLNVVDADIIAEHCLGILVVQFDRRAGETDKRRIRQTVADVTSKAIPVPILAGDLVLCAFGFESVLAAVRFIGDRHHIGAIGQQRELP